jgi:hypothetical protein
MRGIESGSSAGHDALYHLVTIPSSRPGNRHDCRRFLPSVGWSPPRAAARCSDFGTRNSDDGSENYRWLHAEGELRPHWRRIGVHLTPSQRDLRVFSRRAPDRLPECPGTDRSVDPEDGGARRCILPPANRKRRGADAGAGLCRVPAPARRVLAGRREPEHGPAARDSERGAPGCKRTFDPDAGTARCGVAHLCSDPERSAVLIGRPRARQACAAMSRLENVIRVQ